MADGLAAIDRQEPQPALASELADVLRHLHRELARRREDDRLRCVAFGIDALDQRNTERRRLPRAGQSLRDDIAALEQQRDRPRLHRRGFLESHLAQALKDGLADPEPAEVHRLARTVTA